MSDSRPVDAGDWVDWFAGDASPGAVVVVSSRGISGRSRSSSCYLLVVTVVVAW